MLSGLVLAGVAVLLFTNTVAADDKTKALLIGKWEGTMKADDKEVKVAVEFTKDGKVSRTMGGKTIKGTYKVIDSSSLEVTLKDGEEDKTHKIKIKVSKDELEVTVGDNTTKLKRAKKKE
jgi:uncharacterized protein (TIGR03066 family)